LFGNETRIVRSFRADGLKSMTQPTPSDPSLDLLDRWRAGDESARDQILNEVTPWLHTEVSKLMTPRERARQDSMDILQSAVMNFLRWGPRFVPETGAQFRALLKRIAINELTDQRRRLARAGGGRHLDSMFNSANPLSGFAGPSRTSEQPGKALLKAEEEKWVRLALQFLSEEDRYLLLSAEVEGLDWATIAGELGMSSPDAARVRCARLKPKIANVMRRLRAGRMPEDE